VPGRCLPHRLIPVDSPSPRFAALAARLPLTPPSTVLGSAVWLLRQSAVVEALPFRGGKPRRNDVEEDEKDEGGSRPVDEAVVPPQPLSQQQQQDLQDQPAMIHIVRRTAGIAATGARRRVTTTTAGSSSGGVPNRRNALVDSYMGRDLSAPTDDDFAGPASRHLAQEVQNLAHNLTDNLVEWRRTLHMHPELMYQEKQTSAYVQSVLTDLGVEYSTGWGRNLPPGSSSSGTTTLPRPDGPGGYGIVADLGTGQEPCVLLRADMDALPIYERTEGIDEFKSRRDGIMHACGHDGHTTMLLGAVSILKSMEHSLQGTIRIMFQPAEEGGAGAKRMREEGVLKLAPKPSHAFAIHLWPTLPSGVVASRPGPLLAACERFEILVAGVGGHAAMPHLTVRTLFSVMRTFRLWFMPHETPRVGISCSLSVLCRWTRS
jgi:Peptidase family M20/M25/M40